MLFNTTPSASPGDVVSLQGENFGNAPVVHLDGAPTPPLEIVNRVGTGWLAVRIPPGAAGALTLRIDSGCGVSAPVELDAARPYHLDATRLSPGGAFRLFGRNLLLAGSTPSLTIDGLPAAIDLARSDEHMLTATAPEGLAANAAADIVVDNGNGSRPARLDRTTRVELSGRGDPWKLGVGWGGAFSNTFGHTVDPATDRRIADKARCDSAHDDTAALQRAIDLASAAGGGVVRLPTGRCVVHRTLTLRAGVVLQGAGKDATELYVATGHTYPVVAERIDLAGIADLAVVTAAADSDGMLVKNSTRVFLSNVRVELGSAHQLYLSDNVDFVIRDTDFRQDENRDLQGPYTLNNSAGVIFENNTTTWASGAPNFVRLHDSYVHASRFTRNAVNQAIGGSVHSMAIDFAHRVSIVGNTFDVVGGPVLATLRNDGETILSEAGGPMRTENLGTVGSATASTLTDAANTFQMDPFGTGVIPETYNVAIVAGRGAGQMRHVVSHDATTGTLGIDRPWDVVPDGTSRYATAVLGLERVLIKGNTLSQNPRGIWLYYASLHDVDVVDNVITEGGGIYVRPTQRLSAKAFTPMYGVRIVGNRIGNTTGHWMSHIIATMVDVDADGSAFGTALIGLEVRDNEIVANRPNVSSREEEYADTEGFTNRLALEGDRRFDGSGPPRLLGTLFTGNTCIHCDTAIRIGTGAVGTTILNTNAVDSGSALSDTSVTPNGEKSVGTVAR